MSDELREKVAAAISDVEYPRLVPKREHYAMADAAIALARDDALEEAAKECGLSSVGVHFAAAIRALKGKP
jgi:hypothetical protein